MIRMLKNYDPEAAIIVLDIGNTGTHIATWHQDQVKTPLVVPTSDAKALTEAFRAHVEALPHQRAAAAVIGSVVPDATERVRQIVSDTLDREALVIGDAIPLPMDVAVKDPTAVGVDRVCAAFATYDRVGTGCITVDFGTAVTVDLVDDDGSFLGGAILPGVKMQLRSLHEYTSALPDVEAGVPELPYGRDTAEAIQTGVCRGLAGAVRGLVEAYASHLNRWPQVVATGGDVAFMKPYVDVVDTFATDLTLRGIGLAYTKYLRDSGV